MASEQVRRSPLRAALSKCRQGLWAVLIFSLAINVLMLTAPLYMLQVFDRVLSSRSAETLFYLTIIALFAFFTLWILEVVRSRIMIAAGVWLDRQLSGLALGADIGRALYQRNQSTDAIQDVARIRTFLTGPSIFPIFDAPWTPIFLAVIFLLDPLLGWIATAGAAVILGLAIINDLLTRAPLNRANMIVAQSLSLANDAIRNADVIQAMGMTDNLVRRWLGINDPGLVELLTASKRGGFVSATSKFCRLALQVTILGAGAWLVLGDELSAGEMIAASILSARALSPVEQAIGSWRSAINAGASYLRLKDLIGAVPVIDQYLPMPRPKGALRVEGLSFAYPGQNEPLIRQITFEIEPGESLGLIGPSASGKTTLARLMVGNFKPQLGAARLDSADITMMHPDDRLRYIGYLPQDIELFAGTIGQNIAKLNHQKSKHVVDAAVMAGAHDMILRLPEGYDTPIGPNGMTLSGGQRQRIGLSRALSDDPCLVVLDEPGANLDHAGEMTLLEVIRRLKESRITTIIVSHHPTLLRDVDKILVLKNGTMDMFGSRKEIFSRVLARANAPDPSVNRDRWG